MSTVRFLPTSAIRRNEAIGTVVIGQPGSGKTFFLLTLSSLCLGMGQRIVYIDPKNDAVNLLNIKPDLEVIDINKIRPGALNPFTFLDNIDTTTLLTIIEIICGKLTKEDLINITPIIQDFVTLYKRTHDYKDMSDVANYLYANAAESAQKIGTMLKTNEDSKYGKLLFTREVNVAPLRLSDTDSMVISLHGMQLPEYTKSPEQYDANERFTSAILYIITKKLSNILSAGYIIPTTLICDEAHILFGNAEMSKIIDRFLVLGRSLNCAVVLASQGISHFPDNIPQFCSSKFMFRSSMDEARLFLDKFDTSRIDPSKALDTNSIIAGVTNLTSGQCFYIDHINRNGFIKIVSIYDPSLLSSNPYERNKRLMEEGANT